MSDRERNATSLRDLAFTIVVGDPRYTNEDAHAIADAVETAFLKASEDRLSQPEPDFGPPGPDQCPICAVETGDGRLCPDCIRCGYTPEIVAAREATMLAAIARAKGDT